VPESAHIPAYPRISDQRDERRHLLERPLVERDCRVSSAGSGLASHARGRWFETSRAHGGEGPAQEGFSRRRGWRRGRAVSAAIRHQCPIAGSIGPRRARGGAPSRRPGGASCAHRSLGSAPHCLPRLIPAYVSRRATTPNGRRSRDRTGFLETPLLLLRAVAVAQKPPRKSRCAPAAVGARAAGRDDIATDRLRATDEMAVFGAHP